MKRNNWFMIAYILFLIIASVVRYFYNYPMWNSLVLAVTVSSSILSFAEAFSVMLSISKRARLQSEKLHNTVAAWWRRFQEKCNLIGSLIERYRSKTEYNADVIEKYERIKATIESASSQLKQTDKGKEKKRRLFLHGCVLFFLS